MNGRLNKIMASATLVASLSLVATSAFPAAAVYAKGPDKDKSAKVEKVETAPVHLKSLVKDDVKEAAKVNLGAKVSAAVKSDVKADASVGVKSDVKADVSAALKTRLGAAIKAGSDEKVEQKSSQDLDEQNENKRQDVDEQGENEQGEQSQMTLQHRATISLSRLGTLLGRGDVDEATEASKSEPDADEAAEQSQSRMTSVQIMAFLSSHFRLSQEELRDFSLRFNGMDRDQIVAQINLFLQSRSLQNGQSNNNQNNSSQSSNQVSNTTTSSSQMQATQSSTLNSSTSTNNRTNSTTNSALGNTSNGAGIGGANTPSNLPTTGGEMNSTVPMVLGLGALLVALGLASFKFAGRRS